MLWQAGDYEYYAAQVRPWSSSFSSAWTSQSHPRLFAVTVRKQHRPQPTVGTQGRSPFPYALAELVDNALRATKANTGPRRIEITLATSGGVGAPPGLSSQEIVHSEEASDGGRVGASYPATPFVTSLDSLSVSAAVDASCMKRGGRRCAPPVNLTRTLSSACAGAPRAGLISVFDNGCGMSTRELNEWAVMNLSMEDRGHAPGGGASGGSGVGGGSGSGGSQVAAAERFLTGDLSFFGVGPPLPSVGQISMSKPRC